MASAGRSDWIACQITSNPYADPDAVLLTDEDFGGGGLQRISFARPLKLVTISELLFHSVAGFLHDSTLKQIRNAIVDGLYR